MFFDLIIMVKMKKLVLLDRFVVVIFQNFENGISFEKLSFYFLYLHNSRSLLLAKIESFISYFFLIAEVNVESQNIICLIY